MGDVLEHIELEKSKKLLKSFIDENKCSSMIVQVPFESPNEIEWGGNPHEVHIQPEINEEYMKKHFPYLKLYVIVTIPPETTTLKGSKNFIPLHIYGVIVLNNISITVIKMKIGIIQPYFFPYIGYCKLINSVDKFVILDDVQFTKRSWYNRNCYLHNNKPEYFTIPVKRDSHKLNVKEKTISESFSRKKLLKK